MRATRPAFALEDDEREESGNLAIFRRGRKKKANCEDANGVNRDHVQRR